MSCDVWPLYAAMLKSRLFEEAVAQLWKDGLISGEMHLGTGEEGIVAGVVAHLRDGDAMALDHRGTPPLIMRGVDPVLILRELLGRPKGLCGGMGGHMHLFSKKHLAASSGIVGAAGPTAAGFALAAQYLRPGTIALAFFGEAAMNQGMLMEAMNLASAWKLPVLFVCKDDQWAITTRSSQMTGGDLGERSRAFGIPSVETDGRDVDQVCEAAGQAIEQIRSGLGPRFLHARCDHLEGHFLGYQLLRVRRAPHREIPGMALPLTRSFLHSGGAPMRERLDGLKLVISAILATLRDPRQSSANDPVVRSRAALQSDPTRLQSLENEAEKKIALILSSALQECEQ
ncbi:MAG: thiamine pyrophosphate-dependent dehydrogenase E1 component subunit alpha [Chloroflexota bacterium]|nr:thiamine pyrophosphate-dependent dehydrogenase E1 component subunit alpha [Chloroflexota bacterium]